MKQLVFLLLFAGIIKCNAQDGKAPYAVKTYPSSAITKVEASTSVGAITVTGDASGNASVEIYIQGNNGGNLSKDEIAQRLNNYILETGVNGNTLYARAKTKADFDDSKNSLSISFKIHVSQNVGTDLSTSVGAIALDKLNGNQNFKTNIGAMTVNSVSGNITGETNIGAIEANDCKGTIGLTASIGAIKLEQLSGTIKAYTSNGSIDAKLKKIDASARLETSTGGIRLELPQSQALSFDVKGDRVDIGAANNIQVDSGTGYAKGTINGGGALVEASTSAGNVHVSFK
jgi:hypothetical protein